MGSTDDLHARARYPKAEFNLSNGAPLPLHLEVFGIFFAACFVEKLAVGQAAPGFLRLMVRKGADGRLRRLPLRNWLAWSFFGSYFCRLAFARTDGPGQGCGPGSADAYAYVIGKRQSHRSLTSGS